MGIIRSHTRRVFIRTLGSSSAKSYGHMEQAKWKGSKWTQHWKIQKPIKQQYKDKKGDPTSIQCPPDMHKIGNITTKISTAVRVERECSRLQCTQ